MEFYLLAGNNPEDIIRDRFVELELVVLDQGLQLLHRTVMCPRQGTQITQRILSGSDSGQDALSSCTQRLASGGLAGFWRRSWLLEK